VDFVMEKTAPAPTKMIPVGLLLPGRFQPRSAARDANIEELAASIESTEGLIQPITVRPTRDGVGYEIVAGERRVWAYRHLGWDEIPAIVRADLTDQQVAVMSLQENIGREDLSAVEISEGLQRLRAEFGLRQHELASRLGLSPAQISRLLGIRRLPQEVQGLIACGDLNLSAAKVLLTPRLKRSERIDLAKRAAEYQWSVQKLTEAVRRLHAEQRPDADLVRIEKEVGEALACQCELKRTDGRYELRLTPGSPDILSGNLAALAKWIDDSTEPPVSADIELTITGDIDAFAFLARFL
jgi:ParB family transcriptional regulator, chromosome partitioning protein